MQGNPWRKSNGDCEAAFKFYAESLGALAEGGTVRMALQQTCFAARFEMLVDRFDIPWMINCTSAGV